MRICVLRQDFVPLDPRPTRAISALAAEGHEVDVICLAGQDEPRRERNGSVRIWRVPIPRLRSSGALPYLAQYLCFAVVAGVLVTALHLRRRFDLVQVHTLPDTLVFSALIPKLTGARILLDLQEAAVEFFMVKFDRPRDSRFVRLVAAAEQASIRFADFATTCTAQMREAFVARGADPDRLGVVLGSSDEAVFDTVRHPPRGSDGDRFVLVSHGSIEERYGIDTGIRAVALLRDELPGLRFEVIGDGSYRGEAQALSQELGVAGRVTFSDGWIPMRDLLEALASADAGLVAIRKDPFRDLVHTLKMFDMVTMRLPVAVARTRSVQAYFDEDCFEYFESGDHEALAQAIRRMQDPAHRAALVERATEAVAPYRWGIERERYLGYVRRTLDTA